MRAILDSQEQGVSGADRRRARLAILLCVAIFAIVLALEGCGPARPSNVPGDSVFVPGMVGWWQRCSYDPKLDADHCQIFNAGGKVLYDGLFLPYDGGKPAQESELTIDGSRLLRDRIMSVLRMAAS